VGTPIRRKKMRQPLEKRKMEMSRKRVKRKKKDVQGILFGYWTSAKKGKKKKKKRQGQDRKRNLRGKDRRGLKKHSPNKQEPNGGREETLARQTAQKVSKSRNRGGGKMSRKRRSQHRKEAKKRTKGGDGGNERKLSLSEMRKLKVDKSVNPTINWHKEGKEE